MANKDLKIVTRVFEYITAIELSKRTGLSLKDIEAVRDGVLPDKEFIEAVIKCFEDKPLNEVFRFE